MAEAADRPQGVLLGAGGDPQVLGIPIFVVGSIALGLALVGFGTLSGVLPIIALATGFFLLVSTFWSIWLGLSFVAAVFGVFAGFWLSFAALLLGAAFHPDWFGVTKATAAGTLQGFYISWAILILLLTLPALRLPVIYPLILILVVVALVLAALSQLMAAGVAVLIFAALGAYLFLSVGAASVGGKPLPLGPALMR